MSARRWSSNISRQTLLLHDGKTRLVLWARCDNENMGRYAHLSQGEGGRAKKEISRGLFEIGIVFVGVEENNEDRGADGAMSQNRANRKLREIEGFCVQQRF